MPLQIEVQKGKVTVGKSSTAGLTLTLTLICWPKGVVKQYPVRNQNGTVDMKNAVIFQDLFGYKKSRADKKTTEQLVQEAAAKIEVDMRAIIKEYEKEKAMTDSAIYETVRANTESALTAEKK